MPDLLLLVSKKDGVPVRLLFWSREEVDQHLDGLGMGKGTPDNAHLREGLEVRRYVYAGTEAA